MKTKASERQWNIGMLPYPIYISGIIFIVTLSLFFIHTTARIQMSNIMLGQEFVQEYESGEWRRVFQSSWLETWSWSGQDGPSTLFDTCSVLFDLSIFLYMQYSFLYTQCIV